MKRSRRQRRRRSEVHTHERSDDGARPDFLRWLDCWDLRLLGQVADDRNTWELERFIDDVTDTAGWFEDLDNLCKVAARSRRPPNVSVEGVKDWLKQELAADDGFNAFIWSFEDDVRDWDDISTAAAATMMLAYCKARKSRDDE